MTTSKDTILTSPPDWYKDVIIYQVHIKSFCDGNDDGIGDFKGLISKLDYLENLGVNAVWLLPFYPSPLRDDGYDIADYQKVHSEYGTLGDFKRFLREAHARGIRVLTELVLNHTSDQHKWFQRARQAKPGSKARDFYVWSDTPEKYKEARIIFQDFELSNWTWDPVANAYFWHRFYSHQPDLNFENPRVHEALFKVLDFWFEMGVDGMRLDAIPYLYEEEGTNCENLPATYEFLKNLRNRVEERYPDRMLLAEANQWPEDAAKYFGEGDACHMCFHFPLMPRMYMALEMENRYPVIDILEQTPEIPDSCQWALFLRNHDELTLEMVTDEERDYMYRIYVQDPRARVNLGIRRRLAPLLDNDRRKIELMNVLLLTMPGSPIIYYGDEIGMGDNYYLGDRDGVRTPMQWNTDANAGFSNANPQKLYLPLVIDPEYHYASNNVSTQNDRRSSLLWWMRRLISLRKSHKCFGRGEIRFLTPDNPKILAYVRSFEKENVLVVVNLSRHPQMVRLDLADYAGREPEDMFSRNPFLDIDESPYSLTMGPYGYYMLDLPEPATAEESIKGLPRLEGRNWWSLLDDKKTRAAFEKRILASYMPKQRWYGGKARKIREISIREWIHIRKDEQTPIILLVEVAYQEGDPEIYIMPIAYAPKVEGESFELPMGTLAGLRFPHSDGAMYEAVFSRRFCSDLLAIIAGRRKLAAHKGRLQATSGKALRSLINSEDIDLSPKLLGAEQSNTSIRYGEELILKLYRRTDEGVHPDVELVRFLSEKSRFEHIPAYEGSVEFLSKNGKHIVLGLLQRFVRNQGDAWELSLDLAKNYFERILPHAVEDGALPKSPKSLLQATPDQLPYPLDETMSGATLELAVLLGQRTAQMHLALASGQSKSFRPEGFSTLYQRALFQSMQNMAKQSLRLLRNNLDRLPEDVRDEAREVLDLERRILSGMRRIVGKKLQAQKIRIHGDYHLGQVLYTGKDFVIFDFEGEPVRPLSERRIKRSPVRDVAGIIRSYQYAAYTALLSGGTLREEDPATLGPWADLWYQHLSGAFAHGYTTSMEGSSLIPDEAEELENLLVPYLLEKAVYELGYELNNRPDWVIIPIRGIKLLCGE